VTGRIQRADGTPGAGLRVAASAAAWDRDVDDTTDARGAFSLTGLPVDPCSLVVTGGDGVRFVREDVRAGMTDVVIHLPRK
jgi:hypothetical protein